MKTCKSVFKQTKRAKKKKCGRWWWCSLRRRRKDCVVNFVADVVASAAAAADVVLMMGRYCKLCANRSTESVECTLDFYFFCVTTTTSKNRPAHIRPKNRRFHHFLGVLFLRKNETKNQSKANQRNQKTNFHSIFLRNSNVICNDNSSNHT